MASKTIFYKYRIKILITKLNKWELIVLYLLLIKSQALGF